MHLNEGWYFTPSFSPALPLAEDAAGLEPVRLPHTVKELPLNYFDEAEYQLESGYLRFLDAPESWRGKCVRLRFGAAAHEAEVFCNGVSLLTHRCGYTAFTVDLSAHLRCGGRNVIAVRLDSRETLDQPPFGGAVDYLTFGGLYRGVELLVLEPAHFENLFVRGDAEGILRWDCAAAGAGLGLTLSLTLSGPQGETVAAVKGAPLRGSLPVRSAKLWSPESPALYTLRLDLYAAGVLADSETLRVGFRSVDFRADGFYLNGEKLFLRGLNRHQSWPYQGYAVPDRAQALDADILKYELGCNAVRTSHYPQSHAFLDRCDEIGLLVFTEFPGWQHIGGDAWKEQALVNLEEMILQYRGHPSIFLWGVRINESGDDDEFYRRANALAHRLDPTRPTGGVRNFKKSHLLEDVYTYNDFSHTGANAGCEKKAAVSPDGTKGYLISEHNGHIFPTKAFDWEGKRTEQALRHANVLSAAMAEGDIGGCFGWCMFDYNTHSDFGSGDRICYHGVMDAFRNPKTAAALYASQGLDPAEKLVFHVSSAMDIGEYPGGHLEKVWVFTNAARVALYKNGALVDIFGPEKEGRYKALKRPPIPIGDTVGRLLESQEGYDPATAKAVKTVLRGVSAVMGGGRLPAASLLTAGRLMLFKGFTYQKGVELFQKYVGNWGGKAPRWRFAALDEEGRELGEILREPPSALRLEARADTHVLIDGPSWDMATVRIRALDQNGNLAPYCVRPVTLTAQGPVEIIGPQTVALMGGQAGTYLRTLGQAGEAALTLSAQGMESVTVRFEIRVQREEEL